MVRDVLLARLKATVPHRVRVWSGDDEHRDVAVPQRRRRWTTVLEVIERIGWTRCELLDKGGDVLAIVDNEGAPTELEQLSDGAPHARMTELRALGQLLISAQREALSFRDAETRAVLTAVTEVLRATTGAVTEMARVHRLTTQAVGIGARAAAQAEAAGGGDSMIDGLAVRLAERALLGGGDDRPAVRTGRPVKNGKRE